MDDSLPFDAKLIANKRTQDKRRHERFAASPMRMPHRQSLPRYNAPKFNYVKA
jgi:hypothetical protein